MLNLRETDRCRLEVESKRWLVATALQTTAHKGLPRLPEESKVSGGWRRE
jgi:hypothetical protein